jgi:hypothetical protein
VTIDVYRETDDGEMVHQPISADTERRIRAELPTLYWTDGQPTTL